MTESSLGPGSTDRRRHEYRMARWAQEWIESILWPMDERFEEEIDAISNLTIKAPPPTSSKLTEEDFHGK